VLMLCFIHSWRMARCAITPTSALVAILHRMEEETLHENWSPVLPSSLTQATKRSSLTSLRPEVSICLSLGGKPHNCTIKPNSLPLTISFMPCHLHLPLTLLPSSLPPSLPPVAAKLHHYICTVHPHLPPLFINIYAKHFKKFQR
jgi:hypothetical protein